MIRNLASQIAQRELGVRWVDRFVERYPDDLISKWTTGMDNNRHKADSGRKYSLHFDLLREKIDQYLGLSTCYATPTPYYSHSDLGKVLDRAPCLEGLAIDLYPVDLGKIQSLGFDFKLASPTDNTTVPSELASVIVRAIHLTKCTC
jgi:hypothetical protein